MAAGVNREEILADYPDLEDGDITAALEYAVHQSDHPVLRAHGSRPVRFIVDVQLPPALALWHAESGVPPLWLRALRVDD